jgi:hypothetical protein
VALNLAPLRCCRLYTKGWVSLVNMVGKLLV